MLHSKRFMPTIFVLILTTLLFACKKDDPASLQPDNSSAYSVTNNGNVYTVRNLPADTIIGFLPTGQPVGAGKYSFFNLATNTWVSNADSATTNWDLAFAGTTIRINNQTSGPGAGGAFVYVGSFDALSAVPGDSVFRTDNHPVSYAIPRGSGRAWYTYDGPNNLLSTIPGRVLVIRTANGKYAKVEILNYYKGGITPTLTATDSVKIFTSRFYSFRYTYQSNGSTTF